MPRNRINPECEGEKDQEEQLEGQMTIYDYPEYLPSRINPKCESNFEMEKENEEVKTFTIS